MDKFAVCFSLGSPENLELTGPMPHVCCICLRTSPSGTQGNAFRARELVPRRGRCWVSSLMPSWRCSFLMPCHHQVRNTARPILFHLHNKRRLDESAIYNGTFPEESGIIPHPNLFVIQVIHKMILFIDHSCNFHNTFQVGAFFIFYIRVEKTRLERNITQLVGKLQSKKWNSTRSVHVSIAVCASCRKHHVSYGKVKRLSRARGKVYLHLLPRKNNCYLDSYSSFLYVGYVERKEICILFSNFLFNVVL